MDERFITRSIKQFLKKENYYIIQCIPPGGQGGIHFKVENKIMYPDIIAFRNETFIIGESKLDYSVLDHAKLNRLLKSNKLYDKAQYILDNYLKSKNLILKKINNIEMFLAFKKTNIAPIDEISLYNVDLFGEVQILKR